MSLPDPSLLTGIRDWAWTALSIPVVYVWNRATHSVTRKEMADAIGEMKTLMNQHSENDRRMFAEVRDTHKMIGAELVKQGQSIARIEGHMAGRRETDAVQ